MPGSLWSLRSPETWGGQSGGGEVAYGAIVKAQYGARASLGIGVGTVRREAGYRRASTKQGFNFFGDIGFNRSSLFLSNGPACPTVSFDIPSLVGNVCIRKRVTVFAMSKIPQPRTLSEKRSFIIRFDEWPRFSRILQVGLEVGLQPRWPDAESPERLALAKRGHHPRRFAIGEA
jgi:hypothetical protein